MSKLTELLNQIDRWVWQYNSIAAVMAPGLSLDEIHTKAEELPFKLSWEVIELYQWRDGGQNSFLPCPQGGYDLQNFLSLDSAIFLAKEWHQSLYVNVFPLFYLEDILYYTVGSQEEQNLAPIYYNCDPSAKIKPEPDFLSLTAMVEREIEILRKVWKIN